MSHHNLMYVVDQLKIIRRLVDEGQLQEDDYDKSLAQYSQLLSVPQQDIKDAMK